MNSLQVNITGFTEAELDVVVYQEGDYMLAYSPALDLCGQGLTEDESMQSLLETIQVTIEWCIENQTLHEMLLEHGWSIREKPKPLYQPPKFDKNDIQLRLHTSSFSIRHIPIYA